MDYWDKLGCSVLCAIIYISSRLLLQHRINIEVCWPKLRQNSHGSKVLLGLKLWIMIDISQWTVQAYIHVVLRNATTVMKGLG